MQLRARAFLLPLATALALTWTPIATAQVPAVNASSNSDYSQFISGKSVADLFDGVEEQLEEVEGKVSDNAKAIKGKVDPGHSKSVMKIAGRVHADWWSIANHDAGIEAIEGENPQDRLGFRRMRFGVRGKLPANMEYRIEMEFAGGNNSEFRDAWLGWNDLPILHTVLMGNQKRPYGLDHLNSSRYNVFMERPFVIESFNQDARRLGVASYGLSDDLAWNWRYGVYNQRLIQDEGNYISDHYQAEFAGRIANTWWYDEASDGRGYGHWGVSGTLASPDGTATGGRAANEARFRHRPEARTSQRWLNTDRIAGADDYQLLGLEGVLNMGSVQIVGEYQSIWLQRDPGFGNEVNIHGGYVYVSYFLTGEHMPWSRKSGTLGRIKPFEEFFLVRTCDGCIGHGMGAWQVAVRYSYADFNDQNVFGGIGEAVTLGLNWYWTAYSRMQFNYLTGRISDRNISGSLVGGHYDILGARFMVDF